MIIATRVMPAMEMIMRSRAHDAMKTTAILVTLVTIIWYAFMMFFSAIIAGKGRSRGADAALMIVLWPLWVIPESRRGDPFLRWSVATLIMLICANVFLWALELMP